MSMQCLHEDYDHDATKKAMDVVLADNYEVVAGNTETLVEVLDTSEPYNFPRRWDLMVNNEEVKALGLYWVHQGMGVPAHHTNEYSSQGFTMRASQLRSKNGELLYVLNKPGDCIVPSALTR